MNSRLLLSGAGGVVWGGGVIEQHTVAVGGWGVSFNSRLLLCGGATFNSRLLLSVVGGGGGVIQQ